MNRKPRSTRSRPKAGSAALPHSLEIDITALGSRGDGIGHHGDQPVYVPHTVPGDRVLVRVEARRSDGLAATPLSILSSGPDRVAPPCRHFGECGGCAIQHLSDAAYGQWKRDQLVEALARAGFDPAVVAPMLRIPPGTRRRAAFAFARRRGGIRLGFNARASHQLVDVDQCLLLAAPLQNLLPPLRELLSQLVDDGCEGDAVVTLTETGIDLLVVAEARLDLFGRERLAAFADAQDLASLSWRQPGTGMVEPLARRRTPVVRFAGVAVDLPAGAFLQPSREGEQALAALVFDAVSGHGRVADLFAGCGSFTFPLAQKAKVHAVEGDILALSALKSAAERAQARVTAECRDLARRPLLADELKRFDVVVFDPPRAGAAAQTDLLASAGPAAVVAVSCNPATLARDAKTLARGGYRLRLATPVDQFPWTAHLEAVAVFER